MDFRTFNLVIVEMIFKFKSKLSSDVCVSMLLTRKYLYFYCRPDILLKWIQRSCQERFNTETNFNADLSILNQKRIIFKSSSCHFKLISTVLLYCSWPFHSSQHHFLTFSSGTCCSLFELWYFSENDHFIIKLLLTSYRVKERV